MLKTVGKKLRAIAAQHRKRWVGWAHDLAGGGEEPQAELVIETALALGIEDPGEQLSADSEIVREARALEDTIQRIGEKRAERLAPYDGDLEKLRASVATAKAEAARIQELLDEVEWPHCWSYRSRLSRLKTSRPDLFGKETPK